MHVLRSLNQSLEKFWAILVKVLFCFSPNGFQNFFNFIYVDNLFGWTCNRPVFKKPVYQINSEGFIFFQEIFHACHELSIESLETSNFVKRDQNFTGEHSMFLFQWHSVPINNRTKNLQQLSQSIMLLLLIGDIKYQILHFLSDIWSQRHKPAIYPMHDGLEIIPLPWIF